MTTPHFERLRVGLVGYGIGKLYAVSLRSLPLYYPDLIPVDLVAVATTHAQSAEAARKHGGFERCTTDFRELVQSEDINTLIVATPPDTHCEIALAALQAGKALLMDKPLGVDLESANRIYTEARSAGRDAGMIFQFRYCPAVRMMRQYLSEGHLGRIYAFRAVYYRSSYADPQRSLRWKASQAVSGGGVLNDTAPHLIDLVTWLVGLPQKVSAQTRIFIPERPPGGSPVETDDHVIIQAAMPGGALGTIEAGRLVSGTVNDISIEIYGSEASLRWDLMDPNFLSLAERHTSITEQGWRKVPVVQNYPQAALPAWDVPVGMMRFYLENMADFVHRTGSGQAYDPGLQQGVHVQAVVEAAAQAARNSTWEVVDYSE